MADRTLCNQYGLSREVDNDEETRSKKKKKPEKKIFKKVQLNYSYYQLILVM